MNLPFCHYLGKERTICTIALWLRNQAAAGQPPAVRTNTEIARANALSLVATTTHLRSCNDLFIRVPSRQGNRGDGYRLVSTAATLDEPGLTRLIRNKAWTERLWILAIGLGFASILPLMLIALLLG